MRRRLAGALTALLLISSAAGGAESVSDLVRALAGPGAAERLRTRAELLRRKDPATLPALAKAIAALDNSGQTHAQAILEAFPFDRARTTLRRLLRSKSARVRALAAASLFRKGDAAGLGVACRDAVDPRLSPEETDWVVVRLGTVRHPAISDALRRRLPEARGIRFRYCVLHVHWAEDRQAIPELETLAVSPEPDRRMLALAVLFRLGRLEVTPRLARDLADPAGSDRALEDVFRVMARAPEPPEAIETALMRRLVRDPEASIRVRILEELTAWRCHRAIATARKLADHRDPKVAAAAFGLIAKLAGKSEEALLRRTLVGPDLRRRVVAAEALARLDVHDGVPVVIEALASKDAIARREAARVLGVFTLRRVVPPLLDALEDRDALVRTNAWASLRRVLPALFPYRRLHWNGMGYTPRGAPAARSAAVETLRKWWQARSTE